MLRQLIKKFSKHPVAANLLMAIMIISGLWAMRRINVQFLPQFNIEIVRINIKWTGASSEDVMTSVINPIEQSMKDLNHVKKINSIAKLGNAQVIIEFRQGTNMYKAAQDVRERVKQVRNLPTDIEEPVITQIESYETIAKLLISGPRDIEELRLVTYEVEDELLRSGINKIDILGLPNREIRIEIDSTKLANLKMNLSDIANIIRQNSNDSPAGIIGRSNSAKQIRIESKARDAASFANIPVIQKNNNTVLLKDIAKKISLQPLPTEPLLFQSGKPTVELRLQRTAQMNAFKAANIIYKWLEQAKVKYRGELELKLFDEKWQYIQQRVNLLLKNGLGGLILIVIILYLFLNKKVAFWVVAGIPASFMSAIAVLYFYGGSIDMVTLFAFIMSLGIIVDDTIVVGEQALTNLQENDSPLHAINAAAIKMLSPIICSSLTTVAAFLPLFFITGIIGRILFYIPLVVICVIVASVVECFYVLPGHLYHSFKHGMQDIQYDKYQKIALAKFEKFKQETYKPWLQWSLQNRSVVFTGTIALFVFSITFVILGYLKFNFFPSPEGQLIIANSRFVNGTPEKTLKDFSDELDHALVQTKKDFAQDNLVVRGIGYLKHQGIDNRSQDSAENISSYIVELISPEEREISNQDFIQAWQKHIQYPAGIEQFSITSPKGGPPGKDIDIQISGQSIAQLKNASKQLQTKLSTYPGVSGVDDDMPYGQDQLILTLTPTGMKTGLTLESLGRQLNAAYSGELVQIYYDAHDEVEVRVMLPQEDRSKLNQMDSLLIKTPSGKLVPFANIAIATPKPAPDVMKRTDFKLSVHVTAEVDDKTGNSNIIIRDLKKSFIPNLIAENKVNISYRGKAEEQADAFKDMKLGGVLGLTLIYIILCWVFECYRLPLIVLSAIPLGLTGAIIGHVLLRIDLTILSIFGLFGLSGIVINDSIILINEYRSLKKANPNLSLQETITEASSNRLRAVLLTSLTTVAGLTPLLFERSLQAQFLIPMAASISFGLLYATVLILIFIPTLLYVTEKPRLG